MPEDDAVSESFTVMYDNKYYLQVYLGNCTYKTVKKQMTDYLHGNLFED